MDVGAIPVPAAGSWAPGKVAELLGVSPVTLRSWSARYGIGPSARSEAGTAATPTPMSAACSTCSG